jgi:NADPH-ferrihemoprotein reductase
MAGLSFCWQVRRELYSDPDRSCLHLELSLAESGLRYTSGDHVAVYPHNPPTLVAQYASRANVPLDTVFSLKAIESFSKKKNPFPCPCSYRTALTHYLELTHLPNANVLTEFAQYAQDEAEKSRLLFLVSREGRDSFKDYIAGHHRTVLDASPCAVLRMVCGQRSGT